MDYVVELIVNTRRPLTEAALTAVSAVGGAAGGNPGDRRLETTPFFEHRFVSRECAVLLVVFAIAVFSLWAFEAAACPVLQSQTNPWSIRQNFLLFLWLGAFVLCSFGAYQVCVCVVRGATCCCFALCWCCCIALTLTRTH